MVSAASPLAGDDGLGTPFGAPPGRRPGLPPPPRPSPSYPCPSDRRFARPQAVGQALTAAGLIDFGV